MESTERGLERVTEEDQLTTNSHICDDHLYESAELGAESHGFLKCGYCERGWFDPSVSYKL